MKLNKILSWVVASAIMVVSFIPGVFTESIVIPTNSIDSISLLGEDVPYQIGTFSTTVDFAELSFAPGNDVLALSFDTFGWDEDVTPVVTELRINGCRMEVSSDKRYKFINFGFSHKDGDTDINNYLNVVGNPTLPSGKYNNFVITGSVYFLKDDGETRIDDVESRYLNSWKQGFCGEIYINKENSVFQTLGDSTISLESNAFLSEFSANINGVMNTVNQPPVVPWGTEYTASLEFSVEEKAFLKNGASANLTLTFDRAVSTLNTAYTYTDIYGENQKSSTVLLNGSKSAVIDIPSSQLYNKYKNTVLSEITFLAYGANIKSAVLSFDTETNVSVIEDISLLYNGDDYQLASFSMTMPFTELDFKMNSEVLRIMFGSWGNSNVSPVYTEIKLNGYDLNPNVVNWDYQYVDFDLSNINYSADENGNTINNLTLAAGKYNTFTISGKAYFKNNNGTRLNDVDQRFLNDWMQGFYTGISIIKDDSVFYTSGNDTFPINSSQSEFLSGAACVTGFENISRSSEIAPAGKEFVSDEIWFRTEEKALIKECETAILTLTLSNAKNGNAYMYTDLSEAFGNEKIIKQTIDNHTKLIFNIPVSYIYDSESNGIFSKIIFNVENADVINAVLSFVPIDNTAESFASVQLLSEGETYQTGIFSTTLDFDETPLVVGNNFLSINIRAYGFYGYTPVLIDLKINSYTLNPVWGNQDINIGFSGKNYNNDNFQNAVLPAGNYKALCLEGKIAFRKPDGTYETNASNLINSVENFINIKLEKLSSSEFEVLADKFIAIDKYEEFKTSGETVSAGIEYFSRFIKYCGHEISIVLLPIMRYI